MIKGSSMIKIYFNSGAYSGRGVGGQTPHPYLRNFFNLLGFFKKKIPNSPLKAIKCQ